MMAGMPPQEALLRCRKATLVEADRSSWTAERVVSHGHSVGASLQPRRSPSSLRSAQDRPNLLHRLGEAGIPARLPRCL
jgi:hypothetical protein